MVASGIEGGRGVGTWVIRTKIMRDEINPTLMVAIRRVRESEFHCIDIGSIADMCTQWAVKEKMARMIDKISKMR